MKTAAVVILVVAAPAAAAERIPVVTNLYAGRMVTVEQDNAGRLSRGNDLYSLRLTVAAAGPAGLRLAFRGDITSFAAVDPNAVSLETARSVEGYASLSWTSRTKTFRVGPAVVAGALVPVEAGVVDWRIKGAYAGGLYVGRGRSWVLGLAGIDRAADAACSCSPGARAVVAGSLEIWRVSIQGEWISGNGGRKRVGALARLPLPQ